jgi:MFS family permease
VQLVPSHQLIRCCISGRARSMPLRATRDKAAATFPVARRSLRSFNAMSGGATRANWLTVAFVPLGMALRRVSESASEKSDSRSSWAVARSSNVALRQTSRVPAAISQSTRWSGVDSLNQNEGRRPSTLARYLIMAILVRTASGGAAFGVIALAISVARRRSEGAFTGGLVTACLTAPCVVAPLLARLSNRVRDDRPILTGAFVVFGIGLASAAVLMGRVPLAVTASFALVAGLCGPLMTGGLSSKLSALVDPAERTQRRAEAWDALTYGLGATLGPAFVAAIVAASGALSAVIGLGALSIIGAFGPLTLPRRERTDTDVSGRSRSSSTGALRTVFSSGPLRRLMKVTLLAALGTGGLPVVAAVLGKQLGHGAASGAALGAAYGLGNLGGAVAATVRPLKGEPETVTIRMVGLSAVVIGCCALAPSYGAALITFAAAGAASAILFTASLAVRSLYSPPEARAQVFMTMAGLKVASASLGTAITGFLVGYGARALLGTAAVVVAIAAAVALADQHSP